MYSLARISSSFSEPWVAWVMLLMLALPLCANMAQPNLVRTCFANLFSAKERDSIFETTNSNSLGQLYIHIYKLLTLSLAFYILCISPEKGMLFSTFMSLLLMVLLLYVAKIAVAALLAYVYLPSGLLQVLVRCYAQLLTCTCLMLYPVLLGALFIPMFSTRLCLVLVGIIGVAFGIIMFGKAFQILAKKPIYAFYIFLYLFTFELLPVVGIVYACHQFID